MIFEVIIDEVSLLFTGVKEVECQGVKRTPYGKKKKYREKLQKIGNSRCYILQNRKILNHIIF